MMKRVLISLMLSIFTLSVANAASDITDVIKTLRKGKVESALKTRSKIKITSSPDQFLYQLSECLAYNNKKNPILFLTCQDYIIKLILRQKLPNICP